VPSLRKLIPPWQDKEAEQIVSGLSIMLAIASSIVIAVSGNYSGGIWLMLVAIWLVI